MGDDFFPDFSEKHGAQTLYKQEDDGSTTKMPKGIKMQPRLLPQKKSGDNSEPTGTPLAQTTEEWGGGDEVNTGLGEKPSKSTKQNYFAPMQSVLPGNPAKMFKLSKPLTSALDFLPTEHGQETENDFDRNDFTQLGDSKTGFFPEDADPQASVSRSLRMRRQPRPGRYSRNQTNMPEPPFLSDPPIYPVEGGLEPVFFLEASGKWSFSNLKFLREIQGQPVLYVFSAEAQGTPEGSKYGDAVYVVRFFFEKNPRSPAKTVFVPGSTEVFDYETDITQISPEHELPLEMDAVKDAIANALAADKEFLKKAVESIGKEYQTERGVAEPKELKPVQPKKLTKEQALADIKKRYKNIFKK